MVDRSDERIRHFRIGVVSASLRTPMRGLLNRYTSLYEHFLTQTPPERRIQVDVQPTRFSLRHRRRYVVSVNGLHRFEPARFDEVLPYVEWAINWEVPRMWPEYLQLHASSMEVDGAGVIFPGHSGCGKSTLTAGLLARGWRYLCDEFALIHAHTLALHPYPRAICIKKPAYAVIKSLGLTLHRNHHYLKGTKGRVGFVNPFQVRRDAIGRACPIRYVIFPMYARGAEPALTPMSRAEAAFKLHDVCFNLFDCQTLGLDVLAELVRGASCYRLTSGEITATCALVQQLVERDLHQDVRTARAIRRAPDPSRHAGAVCATA